MNNKATRFQLQHILSTKASTVSLLGFKVEKNEKLSIRFHCLEALMNVCFLDLKMMTAAGIRLVMCIVITAVARHQRTSLEIIYTGEFSCHHFKENMLNRFDLDAPTKLKKPLPPPKTDRQKKIDELDEEAKRLAQERIE
ncbi:hypothetical protein SARC_03474 [Sphaeroforma arctica JP610]|uniref:Uncharacterized protein n=1 Tax=Sphaeroforma arctica JP610 TaxID=667725 RepID=A0A0L0G7U7_9EUKA|nr:hypothetical protein SARC_03474 [Sphaeroforma arctica JP610]KNC84313.1 hypothetical protein SARC_03474 [Sphaeroforma arctica JP610]|eukprot:XP_014158215.1 hypothetical protein SARC_03474 [Sphaeroforma arctica JP610]